MPRPIIETGNKFCPYCGESYYRTKYKNGRYQEVDRFIESGSCGKPECVEEHKSQMAKESWARRKSIEGQPEQVKSPVDVWLSTGYSSMNSVRFKK